MDDAVRADAAAWFARHWQPDRPLGEWWALLAESGWGFPMWPEAWFGKGLTAAEARVVDEERRRAGAAGPPTTLGARVIAPLLIERATDEQRARYLFATMSGQAVWCELFSEPGAGSDLASVSTRAVRDGDEWMITGQKVWTSGAPISRWGLLVARSDRDVPQRDGLTCFVVDMDAEGVDTRPLRAMTGDTKFSEVFLTDVRVPHGDVLGAVGAGWAIVRATLAFERKIMGPAGGGGGLSDNHKRPDLDQPAGAVAAVEQAGRQRGATASGAGARALVQALLDNFGGADDPVLRQEIARLVCLVDVARFTGLRASAAMARGSAHGPEASIIKLLTGRITLALREVAIRIEGAHTMLSGSDAPMGGIVQKLTLTSPSMAIMAGTDEIQKNIIGERVLGLPA